VKYYEKLIVSLETAELMGKWCQEPPGDCGRGEAVFDEEVVFSNGNRMAIQVIASEEPNEEECWTQGVVFDPKGNELGCTDVGESFMGEYHVYDGEDEYVCEVITLEDQGIIPEKGS